MHKDQTYISTYGPYRPEVKQQPEALGWRALVLGQGERYEVQCLDEASAKSACIEGAKGLMKKHAVEIPTRLEAVEWNSI
jgi:hypothetical protein